MEGRHSLDKFHLLSIHLVCTRTMENTKILHIAQRKFEISTILINCFNENIWVFQLPALK
jgi:hypothetical protein